MENLTQSVIFPVHGEKGRVTFNVDMNTHFDRYTAEKAMKCYERNSLLMLFVEVKYRERDSGTTSLCRSQLNVG